MVHNSLTNPLSDKRTPPLSVFSGCVAFGSAARDKGSTFELDSVLLNNSDFRRGPCNLYSSRVKAQKRKRHAI
jgi:hypothetical protein